MHQPAQARPTWATVPLLFAALFLSGLSAIVNETVWQRALKVYLAGCESTSAMIVVLAFMLGLGAGSLCMGLVAHRIRNPLRTLAFVEFLLCCVNLAIAAALAVDISQSVYSFQRLAVSLGIPLRLVYGVSAAAVLLLPCFLMGITMPLVSEVAQRQLRCQTPAFITFLFVLNTLGSVLGGLAAGFLLMPYYGQRISLLVGSSGNCAAAVILAGLCIFSRAGVAPARTAALRFRVGRLVPEEVLGFWFGFLSLAFEMYLFRVAALAHEPLPYNFSLVLCYYLLFWSIGVFLAKLLPECIPGLLVISALAVALVPLFHWYDRHTWHAELLKTLGKEGLPLMISAAVYCLPCIPFGMLFGQVISRSAENWGNDVGRYYGLNTLGSCLGILLMTLVGYEYNHAYSALLIAGGYFVLLIYAWVRLSLPSVGAIRTWATRIGAAGVLACLGFTLPTHIRYDRDPDSFVPSVMEKSRTTYYGRGGVIEVFENGDVHWDGLRHATLSVYGNHRHTNDWKQAVVPIMCHEGRSVDDALVIGLGSGTTVGTLARSDAVKSVDVYEIDHTLEAILRDYPEGTLGVGADPKVHLIWQDGRAGLALHDKQYDLITQAPLYLKQAGSSILLSREYMQLVKKRLKKNGVYCIYSNSFGEDRQALLVRKTVASVFAHFESFGGGYMIVASNDPFTYDVDRVLKDGKSPLLVEELRDVGVEKMGQYLDAPRLEWDNCPYMITDNHPLVEYPRVVRSLLP